MNLGNIFSSEENFQHRQQQTQKQNYSRIPSLRMKVNRDIKFPPLILENP